MDFIRRKPTKSLTQASKSRRVLLVCILNKRSIIISLEYLHSLFSKFGTINKILIFEKAKIWKAFVEMRSEKAALEARDSLDNYKIFDDESCINVFISNLETVNLNSTTIDGKDYTIPDPVSEPEENKPLAGFFRGSKKSLTTNLGSHPRFPDEKAPSPCKIPSNDRIPSFSEIPSKEDSLPNPRVIHVKGFPPKETKLSLLLNLFSNFGNVKKLIFFSDIGIALLEFTLKEFAHNAVNFMNNQRFLGCELQVKFSNYQSLSLKKQGTIIEKAIYQNQEVYKAQKHEFRFRAENNLQVNPPSRVIHVSNIRPEAFREDCLRDLFSPFGSIEKMRLLNEGEKKFMCLIRFESLEESFKAIAFLHNQEIEGRRLQLSFSKSQI